MDIPKKMKAAVLHAFSDVRVEERDVPTPGPGEVLVQVEACGICGTDIKIIHHGMPSQPAFGDFIIGHEYAGTVPGDWSLPSDPSRERRRSPCVAFSCCGLSWHSDPGML